MDIRNLKAYAPLMHSLNQCRNPACRNIIMSHLDEPSFRFVNSWVTKGITKPEMLKLSPQRLKTLKGVMAKDRNRLKYLTSPKGTLKGKKTRVRQSGKGIGVLLGILTPLVINMIKNLVKKKQQKKS